MSFISIIIYLRFSEVHERLFDVVGILVGPEPVVHRVPQVRFQSILLHGVDQSFFEIGFFDFRGGHEPL